MVTSYTPSLCVGTEVVKPQLELTKNAPKQISICDPLQYEYVVKNPGTGDISAFTIRDQLPQGIQTDSGKKSLEFRLEDGLKAGETRKFVADLVALKAGTVSSHATAKANQGDLQTRSQAPQTKILQPELAVAIDGQRQVYGSDPIQFTARITNQGNTPAEDVAVSLNLTDQAQLIALGEVRSSDQKVQQSGSQGQPTPVKEKKQGSGQASSQQSQNQQSQNQQGQNQQSSLTTADDFVIDRLDAGQTVAVDFAVRPSGTDQVKAEVVALYRCVTDGEKEVAKTKSTAMATTKVVLMPDLLVSLIDNEGTVPKGGEVTYFLTVRNQGDAPAKQIQASAQLPKQLEFVSGDGPTKVTSDGSSVKIGAVDQLGVDDEVRWTLRAKANKTGEVRVKAELNSSYLNKPIKTQEPTVIHQADQ